jgi:mannose-6-phosphate isomerase-like protein (cupin superfamily)
MRVLGIGLALALAAAAIVTAAKPDATPAAAAALAKASPQTPAAPSEVAVMKIFSSSADVQALLAKAKAEHKEGQVMVAEHILSLAPYVVNLEYRPIEGAVAVHETEAEMVYVLDGTGTLTTSGKLVGEKRTNAKNLSATAIDGGSVQNIAKGDVTIIPENTPHQFKPTGGPLVLMTFHVPRPASEMN